MWGEGRVGQLSAGFLCLGLRGGAFSPFVSLYCGNQTLGGLRQRCPAFPPITADLFLSRDASRFK